ncbi:exodeoxyribonuclease VII small subunit [Brevundimonas sp.]|uniref:exodeoxyribonuclease VII small subunit n=1 Tax=Brevundimonas sp. TaxID=1871086 RepID=UPI0025EAE340|nr:exodeoxyribonuclease VII small subunit [Brevundimonas sp.]
MSATPTDPAAGVADLSFEAALKELEQIVDRLEHGEAPLEESIGLYQRGAALKAHCEKRLEAARLRVEQIVVGSGGQAERAEPADFQ